MEIKLNSYKTYKDKIVSHLITVIITLLAVIGIAYATSNNQVQVESDTADTIQEKSEWQPWDLVADWSQQAMPYLESVDSHERFKEMANKYWLNPSTIWEVENYYWIKEGVILCITVAETSWWHNGAWNKNIGSVWSNDRWDRPTYALMETWLEWIGKTLNNKYLWSIQTLWCLSNAGSCQSRDDNWHRYATSNWNRERNMVACLNNIYEWDWVGTKSIDPKTFIIRR